MVDVAKGRGRRTTRTHSFLSILPEAKLTLYGAIAYIEPAGRALWNCKSLCLYNSLNSKKSVSYIDSVFGLTWSSWERTLQGKRVAWDKISDLRKAKPTFRFRNGFLWDNKRKIDKGFFFPSRCPCQRDSFFSLNKRILTSTSLKG